MIIYPTGKISVGVFNKSGNGMQCLELEKPSQFEEGKKFEFV